jgi:2,4-dienoyl-CoA reductase-like NADH-dependent reductase (Old Yellow Enzyme family)
MIAKGFSTSVCSGGATLESTPPSLFTPFALRSIETRNRIAISPMCQYSAEDGIADDWHFVHLGKFAQGGAGIVFVEATAVEARGRITHGDLGIWSEAQVPPLRRIAHFVKAQGAVPAIQLAHAGRKASMQRPWHGNGPMSEADTARGEDAWPIVAPSAIPLDRGWLVPTELSISDLHALKEAWRRAAERALSAGFEIVEIHSAHGYLLHEFLSPLSNRRTDAYGGDFEGRTRFPLEIAEIVRTTWPKDKAVFVRVSAVDGIDGGWTLEETVAFARELKARGVDLIDCSSGGIAGSATAGRAAPTTVGFQVPFAERVRREVGIPTMAVGLIVDAKQAEEVIQAGKADLIALAREALFDPNWPLHAAYALGLDKDFGHWPVQYGWWLNRRERVLRSLQAHPNGPASRVLPT